MKPWVIWCAALLHLLWAVAIAVTPASAGITAMQEIVALFGPTGSAYVFFSAGVSAIVALRIGVRRPMVTAALLVPQQILLMVSAWNAIHCSWVGVYADGTARPHLFILADQGWTIALCVAHGAGISEALWHRNG